MKQRKIVFRSCVVLLVVFCLWQCSGVFQSRYNRTVADPGSWQVRALPADKPKLTQLLEGALSQTLVTNDYDAAYVRLDYPGGDVPLETGVCSDVVVRAFRAAGLDLQKEIHEDMRAHFSSYPQKWGLKAPDKNIDHRRVPNLQTYFRRQGKALPVTDRAEDYQPGDIVTWVVGTEALPHTGLVTNYWSQATGRFVIVHNIGQGTRMEDRLFDWPVTGHYRYY